MVRAAVPPTVPRKLVQPSALIQNPAALDEVPDPDRRAMMMATYLIMVLGGVGILLLGSCLYALMSFTVTERTRETGIRTALGAPPREHHAAGREESTPAAFGGRLARRRPQHLCALGVWRSGGERNPAAGEMASHRLHHHRARDRRRHAGVRDPDSQGTSDPAHGRDEPGSRGPSFVGSSIAACSNWAPREPSTAGAPDLPASEPRRRVRAVAVSVDNSPRLVAVRLGPCASSRSRALPELDVCCRLYTPTRGNHPDGS